VLVRDVVIRVPHGQTHDSDLRAETQLLALLEARAVPFTPRGVRLLNGGDGKPLAMAYDYVDGRSSKGIRFRGAAREQLARDLGQFLGALHHVPIDVVAAAGLPSDDFWYRVYVPLIDSCGRHLPAPVAHELDSAIRRFQPLIERAPRALVHADISGTHTLIGADNRLRGIIDFGEVGIADPAIDFAGILNDHTRSFLERALTYYGHAVDPEALQRAEFFIALVPLFTMRTAAREGDNETLRGAIADLRRRVRRAVVRVPGGPYHAPGTLGVLDARS